MIQRILLLIASLLWTLPAAAQFTNEPSGFVPVQNCNFSSTPAACGILDVYLSTFSDSDGTASISPPGVNRSTMFAGNNFGGSQMEYIVPFKSREMYIAHMWRTNPEFAGRQVGNKLYFHGGREGSGLFLFGAGGSQGASQKAIVWSFNSAKWNNTHISSDLGLYPNVGSGLATTGQWTLIESYIKASTTYTSRDGIIRWWVNGALAGNYTNVNYAPEGLDFYTFTQTWDGTVNPVPTQNWSHYLDHFRVSVPNCPPGGCSGGGDVTPPSQVTGLVVNSVSSTGASLAWTPATDNVSIAGYQIERCVGVSCTNFSNFLTTNTATASVTLSGLSQGTTYQIRLKAYDAAGNVSTSYSNTVTFATTGTVLPVITTVDADATGANVLWTGSPGSIRVLTDTLNIVEPMSAFPVASESIVHVQSRSVAGSGSSISLAYSSNNAAGNFLALRLTAVPSSVAISNCTDTRGNTWSPVPNATGGSGGYQAIRYAKNAIAGANTVTCTLTGSATASVLDIFEKSGVDRTSPLDQSKLTQQVDPGTGTDAVSSGSVTTTADGELILGGTLQVGSTVYSASGQFSGTQGPIWYYMDSAETLLTWMGSYWKGTGYLSLWDTGGAPGVALNAMRRWVAPADGSVRITGTALNYSGCLGSNGTILEIKKNGVVLWSQLVLATGSFPYDISTTVSATDTLDFTIDDNGHDVCDSTQFDPTITLGTSIGSGGTTTSAGTGFTLRYATASDSPSEDKIQTNAGSVAATFTSADALNDYITSIATFRPASTSIRYSRTWPIGTTFVCMYPRDAFGNENTDPSGYHCDTVTPAADTVAPIRTNLQPSGTLAAGTTTASISVVTNEFATCRYSTSAGIAYGSMVNTLDASANSQFHSKSISGLSNGNTYTYYVRCQDVFLNVNTSDSTISFSIASVSGDVEAPSKVLGLQGMPLNASQISLSWTAATDNVGVTGYEVYVAESGSGYALGATTSSTNVILSALSSSTLHLIKVRARDAVGNFGDDSDATVILTPSLDVTAPSDLVGLVASAVDFQALDLTWTSGTDDVGVTSTNIEQCRGVTCEDFLLVAAVTSGTTVRLSGLLPQTTYRFRGKHTDAAGNVSANYSPIITGTTLAVPTGTVTAVCPCKHHR